MATWLLRSALGLWRHSHAPFPLPVPGQRHGGQTLSLAETIHATCFPALAFPSFACSLSLTPAFLFWLLSTPAEANTGWQNRPAGAREALRKPPLPVTLLTLFPPIPSLPRPAGSPSAATLQPAVCWGEWGACCSVPSPADRHPLAPQSKGPLGTLVPTLGPKQSPSSSLCG